MGRFFLLLFLLFLLLSLGFHIFHSHLHQFKANFLVLFGLFGLGLMTFFFHLGSNLCFKLQKICFHIVEKITLSLGHLSFLFDLTLIFLLFLLLDANRFAVFIDAIEASVDIFMVHEISKWHHQRNSWPIRAERAISRHYVDVFELVH